MHGLLDLQRYVNNWNLWSVVTVVFPSFYAWRLGVHNSETSFPENVNYSETKSPDKLFFR
jgi:hypothetical protein